MNRIQKIRCFCFCCYLFALLLLLVVVVVVVVVVVFTFDGHRCSLSKKYVANFAISSGSNDSGGNALQKKPVNFPRSLLSSLSLSPLLSLFLSLVQLMMQQECVVASIRKIEKLHHARQKSLKSENKFGEEDMLRGSLC